MTSARESKNGQQTHRDEGQTEQNHARTNRWPLTDNSFKDEATKQNSNAKSTTKGDTRHTPMNFEGARPREYKHKTFPTRRNSFKQSNDIITRTMKSWTRKYCELIFSYVTEKTKDTTHNILSKKRFHVCVLSSNNNNSNNNNDNTNYINNSNINSKYNNNKCNVQYTTAATSTRTTTLTTPTATTTRTKEIFS
ncbi:hypothetical protein E2C01_043756 [Portunus trituberculatus]|uniref:Uncharacterized protein n=1 Tax=Portunus trituberculatus TaxID=210409 RepID=A0A5B7FR38_PORTR|nr:hypothetical protein [Portunus trituberculatus]